MNRAPANAEELFNAICELIPDAMTLHKVPGVAFGITCEGRDFIRGFGVTSVDHPLPVDRSFFVKYDRSCYSGHCAPAPTAAAFPLWPSRPRHASRLHRAKR